MFLWRNKPTYLPTSEYMKILKVNRKISFKELDFQESCSNKKSAQEDIFISLRIAQDWSTHVGKEGVNSLRKFQKQK